MKKWMIAILLAAILMCASALAQTTGIALEDKVYSFTGGEGQYFIDGKTFIIGEDSVLVQEDGKPDRLLPIERIAEDESIASEDADIEAAEDEKVIAGYTQYSFEGGAAGITSEDEICIAEGGTADAVELFVPYAQFGLIYDAESDMMQYQGQRVHFFEDCYSQGNAACTIVQYHDTDGAVDICAQRNLKGEIAGIRRLSAEESAALAAEK